MAPNMRAIERLGVVQDRLKTVDTDYEDARKHAKRAKDEFQQVKEQRFRLFKKAFDHISDQITGIYRELTRSDKLPMGGSAYVPFSFPLIHPTFSGTNSFSPPSLALSSFANHPSRHTTGTSTWKTATSRTWTGSNTTRCRR